MKVVTIGRRQSNDVVLNDNTVSREHCKIICYDNGICELVDYSSYGTFVNGCKVNQTSRVLSYRDVVVVGSVTIPWQSYFEQVDQPTVHPGMKPNSSYQNMPNYHQAQQTYYNQAGDTPIINIPSEININKSYVNKAGDDFRVNFSSNLGDTMGSAIGSTLGCLVSIILFIAFLTIIGLLIF